VIFCEDYVLNSKTVWLRQWRVCLCLFGHR